MDIDKLKTMAGVVRIGGKGSVRRKKKVLHKTTTTDDKRLQNILKRIGVNIIPQISPACEVNIFKDDTVIQLLNPKVEVSLPANTWVVSGSPKTKDAQDFLPDILNQLGPDKLRELVEELQNSGLTAEEKTLIKSIFLRYHIGVNQSVSRKD
ncbi:nascent polypeptide-associated complex subunit beta-like [Bidens hawaiensis]|uniref:nascent polypeptide-associated complex subunit beta-like n=1 Tax=Bidens hawaiensis TaxID=980011 RepID=UPI00404932FA